MSSGRVAPPTKLPSLITTPMSWMYSIGINSRNRGFDAGKGVMSFDRPVISIGNLSTGGTGKTPMVHLVVQLLQDVGHNPVIAMRGYGSKPGEKGDEQLEHERALPGVPIVAQPDRAAGLWALFETDAGAGIDCIVLDDGFQHRKIARDLDVVLIDVTRPPTHDALLPKGHLRESIESLVRAGVVVLTHCERAEQAEIDAVAKAVGQHTQAGVPILRASHVWSGIKKHTRVGDGWTSETLSIDAVGGVSARVVCGIGNADAFVAMVRASGIEVVDILELRDHTAITPSMIAELQSTHAQSGVLMTQKDWVKAQNVVGWREESEIYIPTLKMVVEAPEELNSEILSVFS